MIYGRITSKAQTTVPRAVREALGVKGGDVLAYEIDTDHVKLRRGQPQADPFDNPLATFSEWADDLDRAYDDL